MKKVTLIPLLFSIFLFLFVPLTSIQFLSILIMAIYGFSYIISRYLYNSIRVSRFKNYAFCPNRSDESLGFTVTNGGWLSLENVQITDVANGCYKEGTGSFIDSLNGRSSKDFFCELMTDRRGKYKTGPITVKGGDPLHLFPWEKKFANHCKVVVYPEGHPLHLLLVEGERSGSIKSDQFCYEDMTELKGIRDYREGDSLQRINWKASAKSGSLQTMEFSRKLNAPLLVLLDLSAKRYPLKHRHILMERAIEAAVSLVLSYGGSGQKVSLLTIGADRDVYVPSRAGYTHMITILEELAQLKLGNNQECQTLISSLYSMNIKPVSGTHISLLLPRLDENSFCELDLLHRRKCHLKLISTSGISFPIIPKYSRQFILSEYGKEYFYV